MGNFIPVEPEKWAEMVKALALVAEMDKTINASQAECRRLKAENERLRKAGDMMYSWLGVCGRRNNSFGDDWLRAKKGAMLEAEQFDLDMKKKGWTGWNTAKEGKDK